MEKRLVLEKIHFLKSLIIQIFLLLLGPGGIFASQMSTHKQQLARKRTLMPRPRTTPRPTNVTQKMSQKFQIISSATWKQLNTITVLGYRCLG